MAPERIAELRKREGVYHGWHASMASEIGECLDEIERLQAAITGVPFPSAEMERIRREERHRAAEMVLKYADGGCDRWWPDNDLVKLADEIERLQGALTGVPFPTVEVERIRQGERHRAAEMVRDWVRSIVWYNSAQADSCFNLADEIEKGEPS